MNDQKLKNRLSKFTVPEADSSAQEKALHRATTALANADGLQSEVAHAVSNRWIPWLAIEAMALVVLIWALVRTEPVHPKSEPTSPKNTDLAGAFRTLRQMEVLFPGQINAIIEKNHEFDVELADVPAAPSDQPLIVNFKSAAGSIQILSYSGRKICVDLDGQLTCFEAILTSDGGVILSGKDFLWTSQDPAKVAGHSIEARQLIPTS